MAQPYQQPRPAAPAPVVRVRRKRALWQTLLMFVLVLAVLVVVGDRVGSAVAESQVESRMGQELSARGIGYSSVDVTIAGFPFLTQVAQGHYESIEIEINDAALRNDSRTVTVPVVHVAASGVDIDTAALVSGDVSATAEQVTATAVIAYDALGGLIDASRYRLEDLLLREQDGAVWASANLDMFGAKLPIEAGAEISLGEGRIEVRLRDINAVGMSVPSFALSFLDTLLNEVLVATVPRMPFDVTIDSIQNTAEGLAVTATGRDIVLVGSGS